MTLTANERLRVAGALDAMPVLDQALASGDLPYSAVREISRVAISTTEEDWVDACRGKNLRQIEELVAQRAEGDLPDSPPRPELRRFVVRLELNAAEYALWRQATRQIQQEQGASMEAHSVLAAMCAQTIEGAGAAEPESKAPERRGGRAKYQIAVTICRMCKQGWQEAGGRSIAIEPADVARAECDAQRIGSLEGPPGRVTQDIPPKTRRFVLHRDRYRCTVPGCRASRFIEVHHIEHRATAGDHRPGNLTSLCGGHHDAHHRGTLRITGLAPDLTFETVLDETERAHVVGGRVLSDRGQERSGPWSRAPTGALSTCGSVRSELAVSAAGSGSRAGSRRRRPGTPSGARSPRGS